MRLPGEEDRKPMGASVIYMVIGVSVFVLVMLLVVMKNNKKADDRREYAQNAAQQQEQTDAETETEAETETATQQKLRAEDLDFWDMYPVEGETDTAPDLQPAETGNDTASAEAVDESEEGDAAKGDEVVQEDPSTDGKHTLVKAADGTEEWVLISPYLTKNTYDFTNLSESANLKKYTENGKKISYVGVDISKHNGSINFRSLKASGVDYVMIRLGARGYSTGQLSLDDNFAENMEEAVEAGLDIGIYFYSQAINQEEAVQEVNFVVQNLEPYRAHITYPVAFDMENVSNDKARIDQLSRDDKTTITSSFLSGIQAAGYAPMIYGNKEWLIKNIDLAKLQDYDIWLSQDEDIPDYPYQYTMWQYTTTGVVNCIK